jgi:hypothetical protein
MEIHELSMPETCETFTKWANKGRMNVDGILYGLNEIRNLGIEVSRERK